jgi:hypothetical protein
MNTQLATVGPMLALSNAAVSADQFSALSLSLCWAQAVARKTNQDVTSAAYSAVMFNELARVGWTVAQSSSTHVHRSGSSANVAQMVPDILASFADPGTVDQVRRLFSGFSATSAGPGLDSFMSTWWASQSTVLLSRAFVLCPAVLDPFGQLSVSLVNYEFGVDASSWLSFFVTSQYQELDVDVTGVSMTLNFAIWSQISDAITQRLGAASIASIGQLSLDL